MGRIQAKCLNEYYTKVNHNLISQNSFTFKRILSGDVGEWLKPADCKSAILNWVTLVRIQTAPLSILYTIRNKE